MGSAQSADKPFRPLAIAALARQVCLSRRQVIILRDAFVALSSQDEMITRDNFHSALEEAKVSNEQDREILDLLFTMWDSEGYDKVPFKEFSMGIAPLACPDETPGSILRFALEVSDQEKTGLVGPEELEDVLLSIDSTASYFGDSALKYACIRRVVDHVFEDQEEKMMHKACVHKLIHNPYIRRFVSGKTRVTFQEDVAEQIPSKQMKPKMSGSGTHKPPSSLSISIMGQVLNVPRSGPYQPPSPVNLMGSILDTWSISTESALSPVSSPRSIASSPLSSPRHSSLSRLRVP